MKRKKEIDYKNLSTIYFIASLIWYIAAFLGFIGDNNINPVIHLCLGSAWLCLGAVYLNKSEKDDNKDDNKE